MSTGAARYERVAEAAESAESAESALDAYVLKPFAANALANRLRQARHRKRVLRQIFEAIEADAIEAAA